MPTPTVDATKTATDKATPAANATATPKAAAKTVGRSAAKSERLAYRLLKDTEIGGVHRRAGQIVQLTAEDAKQHGDALEGYRTNVAPKG